MWATPSSPCTPKASLQVTLRDPVPRPPATLPCGSTSASFSLTGGVGAGSQVTAHSRRSRDTAFANFHCNLAVWVYVLSNLTKQIRTCIFFQCFFSSNLFSLNFTSWPLEWEGGVSVFSFLSLLVALRHTECPGQGLDTSSSCDLRLSGCNTRSLTHQASGESNLRPSAPERPLTPSRHSPQVLTLKRLLGQVSRTKFFFLCHRRAGVLARSPAPSQACISITLGIFLVALNRTISLTQIHERQRCISI